MHDSCLFVVLLQFFLLVFCRIYEFSTNKPKIFPSRIYTSTVTLTLNEYDVYSDIIKKESIFYPKIQ